MTEIWYKLPTVLTLGALVVVLLSMRREHRTPQFHLWVAGWAVVFFHLCIQIYEILRPPGTITAILETASVLVAGDLFIVSLSRLLAFPLRRRMLILWSVPGLILYCVAISLPRHNVLLAAISCGELYAFSLLGFWRTKRHRGLQIAATLAFGVNFFVWFYVVERGRPDLGFYAAMSFLYGLATIVTFRFFRRFTVGVLTMSGGFAAWALVAPIYLIQDYLHIGIGAESDLWNVPKFIVALGMVVTLLENERARSEHSQLLIQEVNEQMRHFADLTYRLLRGADVPTLCPEIANAIHRVSNYERVAIVLADPAGKMRIVGHAGIEDTTEVEKLAESVERNDIEGLDAHLANSAQIGSNSFRSRTEKLSAQYGAIVTSRQFPPNPYWSAGDEILVPIRSSAGKLVGVFSLDDPKRVERVNAEDLSALEILASEIGAAIETASLQSRLVRSEKLAGIGQLVAGVGHELNNPLTAVLGYAEMLGERAPDESMKRDLGVLRKEAVRMKRIIEDLQRFSRHGSLDRIPLSIAQVVNEVLSLRKIDLHSANITVELELPAGVPPVMADPSMLKQALLNILANAIDAVAQTETKTIRIEAGVWKDRLVLKIIDGGPGFRDTTRAFDPFYTTKAPGKGTGLGLSIAYGIIKEHGGDVLASNIQPHGACLAIELPMSASVTPLTNFAEV